jgi:hypothetical protein
MRLGSYTVALLTSLVVFASIGSIGCGGKHQEAKVAESDPWAGYKGTYAAGAADPTPSAEDKAKVAAETETKADPKPGKKPKGKRGKKGAAADDATAAAADPPAAAAPPDKPVSASASSPSALYGDGTSTATTTSAGDDTAAAPVPKKPKKKAAKKKKPAAPAQ